jgi:hypothetical protein
VGDPPPLLCPMSFKNNETGVVFQILGVAPGSAVRQISNLGFVLGIWEILTGEQEQDHENEQENEPCDIDIDVDRTNLSRRHGSRTISKLARRAAGHDR